MGFIWKIRLSLNMPPTLLAADKSGVVLYPWVGFPLWFYAAVDPGGLNTNIQAGESLNWSVMEIGLNLTGFNPCNRFLYNLQSWH